jgi:hypothetical protein
LACDFFHFVYPWAELIGCVDGLSQRKFDECRSRGCVPQARDVLHAFADRHRLCDITHRPTLPEILLEDANPRVGSRLRDEMSLHPEPSWRAYEVVEIPGMRRSLQLTDAIGYARQLHMGESALRIPSLETAFASWPDSCRYPDSAPDARPLG